MFSHKLSHASDKALVLRTVSCITSSLALASFREPVSVSTNLAHSLICLTSSLASVAGFFSSEMLLSPSLDEANSDASIALTS